MVKNIELDFKYPEFILPAINDQSHYVIVPAGRQIGKTYNFAQWICKETKRHKIIDGIQAKRGRTNGREWELLSLKKKREKIVRELDRLN